MNLDQLKKANLEAAGREVRALQNTIYELRSILGQPQVSLKDCGIVDLRHIERQLRTQAQGRALRSQPVHHLQGTSRIR